MRGFIHANTPPLPNQRRRFAFVIECGLQAAPLTIALIPGWCMPAWLFEPQFDALGEHHRVIALDPRGQGESDVPDHGYNFERRSADIAECLQGYENVLLVGWSLGALEVLEYAHRYGEGNLAGMGAGGQLRRRTAGAAAGRRFSG